ncbi:MAG: Mur ligase family protein, partial [Phycisphaerae bacterium]
TNLSGDHLDYHEDMEGYLRAKRRLFEALGPEGWAIVNRDDAAAGRLLERCRSRVLGFGLEGGAEVGARIRRMELAGSSFELISAGGRVAVRTALMGRHNVLNALAAAATGVAWGIDLETIRRGLEKVDRVPGRLERVGPEGGPITVLVDYAHSDDALRNVLEALRPIKRGRLIVVFGCGGERDRSKRPRMGRVACELGDVVIVTSDNPRGERPQAIIDEILAGIEGWGMERVEVEPERRKAIWRAVELADEGDVVVIAGKGHERYQVVAGRRLPFDDVAVAAGAVRRRLGSGA